MDHNRFTHRDGINSHVRDFPGGPVVKTSPSNAGHVGSIPGWGIKISHASWPKNQNIKQRQYCQVQYRLLKTNSHLMPPDSKALLVGDVLFELSPLDISQGTWPVFLRTVKVMKVKERLRKCHRTEETGERDN